MLLAPRVLAFEDFRFDVRTRELSRIGADGSAAAVVLGSRATDLLLVLLSRPGELVTKNEIREAVWPNTTVEDSNLSAQMAALRRALDTGRSGASCIQTVPGRGYRFTPQVIEPVEPDPLLPTTAARTPAPVEAASQADAQLPQQEAPSSPHAVGAAPMLTSSATTSAARWALFGAGATLVTVAFVALLSRWVFSDNPCQNGLVPRQAFRGDRVCVTPAVRAQTIADNIAAPSRTLPSGLCMRGYVWRRANPDDHVCVTRAAREQAQSDNQAAR
jgi:DNA-binding winged helix-turn-helix (wHTH) protein